MAWLSWSGLGCGSVLGCTSELGWDGFLGSDYGVGFWAWLGCACGLGLAPCQGQSCGVVWADFWALLGWAGLVLSCLGFWASELGLAGLG